jgi:hypothetical protein
VLRPDDWNSAEAMLTPGCDVAQPYRQLMQEADFTGCSGGC